MDESKVLSRRVAIRRSLTVLAALPMVSLVACGGEPEAVHCGGATGAQAAARSALQYVERGPDPARHCSACQLYTGNPTSCGACQLLEGEINPQGTCTAFVARS